MLEVLFEVWLPEGAGAGTGVVDATPALPSAFISLPAGAVSVWPSNSKVVDLCVPLSTNLISVLLLAVSLLAVAVSPPLGIGTFASMFPPESTSSIPISAFPENIKTTCPGTKS